MSDVDQMRTFIRVVDAGGISAAADQLDIAKSAVSRRLMELEKRLGVRLLNRTTRRMSLTDSGHSFYARTVQILEDIIEAEEAVSATDLAVSGRLRIAVPLSFGLSHVGPAVNEFLDRHPGVEFDIDFNDRQVDLVQEGFDMAVRIGDVAETSLVARRIATIRNVVCASPAYWKGRGMPKTPEDLKRHSGMRYTNLAQGFYSYRGPDGRPGSIALPARLRASNGDFLRDAAIAGHGVFIGPMFIVHEAIAAGQLETALHEFDWPPSEANAVYPANRHLSRRARLFIEWLTRQISESPYWDPTPA